MERKIGNYRIIEYIGGGGFGSVFKAEDMTSPGRIVAIKELHKKHTRSQIVKQRFFQEALAMARLSHPNLPQIYSFGEEDGCYYLVMEFVSGRPLSEEIERNGAMRPDRAIAIMRQVLSAVGYAHRCGIIHRDLKPDNIMLVGDADAVKVLDFGIAKIIWGEKITLSGHEFGTPSYMSPERLTASPQIDHRTDIYSLGIIMFEMLSGQVPFKSKATDPAIFWAEMRKLHLEAELPSLAPFGAPPELERIIRKAAAKRPEDRYATAEDMMAALGGKCGSASLLLSISPSPAEVFVDEIPRGSSNQTTGKLLITDLAPGAHSIRVSKRGYEPYKIDVLVPDGQQVELRVALAARQTVAIQAPAEDTTNASRPTDREDQSATLRLGATTLPRAGARDQKGGPTTQLEGTRPERATKWIATAISAALLAGLALAAYLLMARNPSQTSSQTSNQQITPAAQVPAEQQAAQASNQQPAQTSPHQVPAPHAPPQENIQTRAMNRPREQKSEDQPSKETTPEVTEREATADERADACIAVMVRNPDGSPARGVRVICIEEAPGSTSILRHGRTNNHGMWHACGFTAGRRVLFAIRQAGAEIGRGQVTPSPGKNFVQIQTGPATTIEEPPQRPFRRARPRYQN